MSNPFTKFLIKLWYDETSEWWVAATDQSFLVTGSGATIPEVLEDLGVRMEAFIKHKTKSR